MAKAGFWLRGTTGKLAGSALQKGSNGNTVIREVVKPKNPKTTKQTLQRVLMNTVMQGYSAMRDITSHSFQGVSEGRDSMNHFMSENLKKFRQRAAEVGSENLSSYVNFSPLGNKGVRPARFIVSDGNLPSVPLTISTDAFMAKMELEENTYEEVIEFYNLRRGDQLTFVTIEKHTVDQENYVHYARVILDPRNSDGTPAALSSAFINQQGGINLPSSRNEGLFKALTYADDAVNFRLSNGHVCCAGCIVSRENGDDWLRSKCQLVLCEEAIAAEAVSLPEAITLSRQGYSIELEDDDTLYLNHSGVGGGQSSSGGSSSGNSGSSGTGTNTGGNSGGNSGGTTTGGDEPGEDRP